MRIKELLESKQLDDMEWIRQEGDKRVLDFDLAEDLVFFMNNDDDTYRRHVYPKIHRCVESMKAKRKTTPAMFADAVKESYKNYVRKFPIRELPNEIDEKLVRETCDKMHEEVCKHISDGKYKD
jgi:hypothetical protein